VDSDAITRAGLAALDDVGFDKLSMRRVASRLGVHVVGLYQLTGPAGSLGRLDVETLAVRFPRTFSGIGQFAVAVAVAVAVEAIIAG
jgi:hypothetical protein